VSTRQGGYAGWLTWEKRGFTAVSTKRNAFVIDNVTDGFDIHQLGTGTYVCTLTTGPYKRREPKQVAFAENSKVAVGGSDHGSVYVFDRRNGSVLEVLRHAGQGLVQTIAVGGIVTAFTEANGIRQTHGREGVAIIAAASSDRSGDFSISLWMQRPRQSQRMQKMETTGLRTKATRAGVLWMFWTPRAAMLLLLLATTVSLTEMALRDEVSG
jgi:hypothetical protein